MRIEEERQGGAQGQRRVGPVCTGGIRSGDCEQQFLYRHGCENLAKAAKLDRNNDDGGESRHVDQYVLDDRDRSRRAQTARIGEGRQDYEGNNQRQIGSKSRARYAERTDDDLDADKLESDIGHGCDDAGDRHRQCQPAVAEATAHEIARGDVAVLVADVPEPREDQEQDRVDHDRIRHREECDGAGTEGKRRNGDKGVGGIEIAAD